MSDAEPENVPPPDYSAAARLLTLFACVPLGLLAQSSAREVLARCAVDDWSGARESSRKAFRYCLFAGATGLAIWSLGIVAFVIGLTTLPTK
jgi:hypothetical protein